MNPPELEDIRFVVRDELARMKSEEWQEKLATERAQAEWDAATFESLGYVLAWFAGLVFAVLIGTWLGYWFGVAFLAGSWGFLFYMGRRKAAKIKAEAKP